jgi:hypothetical protein
LVYEWRIFVPERKVKLTIPNLGPVEGTEVQILESTERWSDIKLADGTTLHLKPVVLSVARIDGRYGPQDNPMYAVSAGQAMTSDAPDHLRRGAESGKVQ